MDFKKFLAKKICFSRIASVLFFMGILMLVLALGQYVSAGPFYGLQCIAPGQTGVEGAGNSNVASGAIAGVPANGWYSGVTPTDSGIPNPMVYAARAQAIGSYFSVTVQAVDVNGNFLASAPSDTIQLFSSDTDVMSEPNISIPLTQQLIGGRAFFSVRQIMNNFGGVVILRPINNTNGSIKGYPDSYSQITIADIGATTFVIFVNGVRAPDNTPVYVQAKPNQFTVRVETRLVATNQILALSQPFIIEPYLEQAYNPTAAHGQLEINIGQTMEGISIISNQTYDVGENIYLRVRNSLGGEQPQIAWSGLIIVQGGSPVPTETPDPQTPTITPTPLNVTSTPTLTPTSTPTSTITETPIRTQTPNPSPLNEGQEIKAIIDPTSNKMILGIPASEGLTQRIEVSVRNLKGEVVLTKKETPDAPSSAMITELITKNLANGVYILQVKIFSEKGMREYRKKIAIFKKR